MKPNEMQVMTARAKVMLNKVTLRQMGVTFPDSDWDYLFLIQKYIEVVSGESGKMPKYTLPQKGEIKKGETLENHLDGHGIAQKVWARLEPLKSSNIDCPLDAKSEKWNGKRLWEKKLEYCNHGVTIYADPEQKCASEFMTGMTRAYEEQIAKVFKNFEL